MSFFSVCVLSVGIVLCSVSVLKVVCILVILSMFVGLSGVVCMLCCGFIMVSFCVFSCWNVLCIGIWFVLNFVVMWF